MTVRRPITTTAFVVLLHTYTLAPLCTGGLAYNAHHHTVICRRGTRQRQQPQQPSCPARRRVWWSSANTATHQQQLLATSSSLSSSTSTNTENDDILESTATTSPSSPSPHRTALSMNIDELSIVLGGKGRARIAWDCYVEGVDPQYLFHSTSSSGGTTTSPSSSSSSTIPIEYHNPEQLKRQILPTPRQTQPLGSSTLTLLSNLHSHCTNNGQIENGLATLVHTSTSSDGTTKLLLRLRDGLEVETVLIPFWNDDEGRTTVCISSQVGCKQACQFCATGKMGKIRSLTVDEILVQLFYAKKIVRLSGRGSTATTLANDDDGDDGATPMMTTMQQQLPKISNIVFMGMGEPTDNASAVRHAVNIMTQNELFQLSANRVTVSTVAPTPHSFAEFGDSRCVLAWSVHATRDELRKQLVPTTKYTMAELRDGLIETLRNRRLRTCMIEVALMDGVNDSMREADEMAEFILYISNSVSGSKLICNLIPYNDIGAVATTSMGHFRKPTMERVLAFQQRLQAAGIYAHVRGTRGDDESAACGQLVTSRNKKETAMQG